MVGRLQVAAAGAMLDEPARPIEVAALLKGDNSEEAFAELRRPVQARKAEERDEQPGCVATFTPIPGPTLSTLHAMELSTSGNTATTNWKHPSKVRFSFVRATSSSR
jgi:hypothetical protein